VLVRPCERDIHLALAATDVYPAMHFQVLGTGSELHQTNKRRTTFEALLGELDHAVRLLRRAGRDDISVILEDASRGSPRFVAQLTRFLHDLGIAVVHFADTVGAATPPEIAAMIGAAVCDAPDGAVYGIHCHDDLGLATANTLAAIAAGAQLVHTTIGGLGERAGNCALEQVVAVLHYKRALYGAATGFDLAAVHTVAHRVFEVLGRPVPPSQPLVGEHVFSTAAGLHQNGLIKDPLTYEAVRAEDFGRRRRLVFNRLSGRSILRDALPSVAEADLVEFESWLLALRVDVRAEDLASYYARFAVETRDDEALEATVPARRQTTPIPP
jgi:2-isopropylmalate synthase